MRRFTRRLLTRKISVPLWFVVFVMCTVIFTRKETETTRRLYEKQLNGSENHKRNQLCDKCKEVKVGQLNPTFSIQYPNRTTPDKELRELTRKVEMYEKLNSLTEFHSWVSKFGSKRRQNVLIISDLRSGSAFLGELFNQHPRIFYLYEPLEALEFYRKNRPERIYDGMSRHLLRGIFHCNYLELSYFTDFLSFQYSSLTHRMASRSLASPPLCPDTSGKQHFNIRMCTPLRPQTVSALCRLHKHTVIKTVHVRDIHKLSYLMDDRGSSDYTMKIVHLVRDPRAIVNSRVTRDTNVKWTLEGLRTSARTLCSDSLRNIKYAVSAPPWLHGHYTLLRYEDLVSSPQKIAEQLYSFLGIAIAPEVRTWIDGVLKTEDPLSSGLPSALKAITFSGKNLTESVNRWRRTMPYSIVRIVETECYEVMNLLGYKVVEDEEELRTASQSLVE